MNIVRLIYSTFDNTNLPPFLFKNFRTFSAIFPFFIFHQHNCANRFLLLFCIHMHLQMH